MHDEVNVRKYVVWTILKQLLTDSCSRPKDTKMYFVLKWYCNFCPKKIFEATHSSVQGLRLAPHSESLRITTPSGVCRIIWDARD